MIRRHRLLRPSVALAAFHAVLFPGVLEALDTVVVFNEIHYHPAGADDPSLEFVELYNQHSVDVDLSGWRLSGGVDFRFPAGTVMRGGEFLVVASDPVALQAAAGISGVLGPFIGMLDNGGERLRLRNHNDRIMDEVEYNDRAPWPVGADGGGVSLAKRDAQTSGSSPGAWVQSVVAGGTPRGANLLPPGPFPSINEVAGSAVAPGDFFVEIHNPLSGEFLLEGFVLATEGGDERELAPGTRVPPGGVVSIGEAALGFRPADGDKLYLFQPGKAVLLDAVQVDDTGRARSPDGTGALLVTGGEVAASPGLPNPGPPVRPIVINEIMYHHRPTYPEAGAPGVAYEPNDEEWIELHNRSEQAVAVGGWELDGAVRFTIPAGGMIPAGGYLVVAREAAAFAAKFPGVPVVGDFSGSLSNRGEELVLRDAEGNPADRVFYRDGAPWPKEPDGGGSSLELINPHLDNEAPGAWQASDNGGASQWHTYEFTLRARTPVYTPRIFNFHELRLGLLDAGSLLLDDVSVVEDPGGANRELMANGSFNGLNGWKLIGTHQDSRPTADEGERVLRVTAVSRMNYLNNLIEGNLTLGGAPRPVQEGQEYRVSFRAKWLSGSPQFRCELYYNKLARTVILRQPEAHGTPGARNSTYQPSTGPVFRDLRHAPAVPDPGETIEVSTLADDPDGLATMNLFYRVGTGSFRSLPMSLDPGDGRWKGTIPGQANGALIHFYVQGHDAGGMRAAEPPGGSRSRALIKVDSSTAHGRKHSIRILMLASDINAMHLERDILSNYRHGCTIITDEKEIAYDAGIRLRGSMFSRRSRSSTALNLKFPSDRLYRGVHSTITTRRANRREILVKHIINQVGGIHDNYNDLFYQYGHVAEQVGPVRVEMARFGSDYLRGLPGGDGTEGTVFKMEGIREFQQTQDGTANTPKLPFPIGWINAFDIADQGDDKETYRHNMRINSNFEEDNYEGIIRMSRIFSLNGQALEDAVPLAIDVDRWTRQFALLSLCGINDTYSQGNPHNLNFYVRPGDGLVEPMPWDWDFTFNRPFNAPLWGNRNVSKIFARPVYARLYYGHLRDMIETTFNSGYLASWFRHYGLCSGENYIGHLNYITDRANYVLSRLPARVTFRITTNNGSAFSTPSPTVTLRGDGWIDVREVFLNRESEPVALRWTDGDSWELTAPLQPGENTLSLSARDHRGRSVGSDTIIVTNTGAVEPASAANLAIGELMYHPAGGEAEEFIEIVNISAGAEVDLGGASFTEGIEFVFPPDTVLPPGGRLLVVENRGAFEGRYGAGQPVAGEFANGTRLSNGGERVRFEGLGGAVIREFVYGDSAPWPEGTDGDGFSLVLVAPAGDPDHADPLNWRASVQRGGTPGGTDAVAFSGDPDGDDDGDGLTNFMNHALGEGGARPSVVAGAGGEVTLTHTRNVAADDVVWGVETSEDLVTWIRNDGRFVLESVSPPAGGLATVVWRRGAPVGAELPLEFVRLRVEKRIGP